MNPGSVLLFLSSLLSAGFAGDATAIDWTSDLCARQEQFFTSQFRNRISVDGLAQDFAASGAAVLLVGENHGEEDNRYYPFFLEKLKAVNPTMDCVTFELNRRSRFPVDFGSQRWLVLADRAKSLKVRAFQIDGCIPSLNPLKDMACLDGRNAYMSQKFKTLLKAGICHKVLHIGGSYHLQNNQVGGGPNLAERLRAFGIANYRVQFVDTALESTRPRESKFRENDPWIWGKFNSSTPVCKNTPGVVRENFAFLNRGVADAQNVPVFYRHDAYFQSRPWSDFDAALIVGCPDRGDATCPERKSVSGYLNRDLSK